eukprot:TRINITY_DN69463_c0_g1_i1.p1 TRINITY_DN69463_c0_g1~~TRINITY_DN69463_c0_g1_i1.p1  ORF type:complete len:521 (-),score=71.27 TRINITY_DN69463_c0_g1_i1:218-1705(-)
MAASTQSAGQAAADAPIVVIGQGILGATTALRLAHAGRRVVVLGSTPTTTNMALGWISGHRPDSKQQHLMNRLSRHMWEALLDEHLGREGYLGGGCLRYGVDDSASGVPRLRTEVKKYVDRGFPTKELRHDEIRQLVPELANIAKAAFLHPEDAVLQGSWAARRALERAKALGADVRPGTIVTAFERRRPTPSTCSTASCGISGDGAVESDSGDSLAEDSVVAVRLADGSRVACSSLVLAAGGKGNNELGALLGLHLPIKGIWGIQLKTRPLQRRLTRLAMLKQYDKDCGGTAGISYGQYPDKAFVINEKLADGEDMNARLLGRLKSFARLWPELDAVEVAYMAKTVRWVPEDNDPVCGFAPAPNRNVYVLLTNSDGINMAALLSELATTEVCGGESTGALLQHCLPGRFSSTASSKATSQAAAGGASSAGTARRTASAVCGEALSGDGTLEHVGIRLTGKFQCAECQQRFDSERAERMHWRFVHDPSAKTSGDE